MPDIGAFVMKAFYEKDPEVRPEIQKSIEKYAAFRTNIKRMNFDPEQFVPGLDIGMMYQDMYWASEGYLLEKLQSGQIHVHRFYSDGRAL